MPWKGAAWYSTYRVRLYDRLLDDFVTVTRRTEDYHGYHALGRFSYRGERLQIILGPDDEGVVRGEDYPPPAWRCRTRRAKEYWEKQGKETEP